MDNEISLRLECATWIDPAKAMDVLEKMASHLGIGGWRLRTPVGEGACRDLDYSVAGVAEAFGNSRRLDVSGALEFCEVDFYSNELAISGQIRSVRVRNNYSINHARRGGFFFNEILFFLSPELGLGRIDLDNFLEFIGDQVDAVCGRVTWRMGLYPRRNVGAIGLLGGLTNVFWKNYYGPELSKAIDWFLLKPEFLIRATGKGTLVTYDGDEAALCNQGRKFEQRIGEKYFWDIRKKSQGSSQAFVLTFLAKLAWRAMTEKRREPVFDFDCSRMTGLPETR